MNIANLHPKTELGIKRFARQKSRLDKIKYSDALNLASKAGGYENYADALKHFPKKPPLNSAATGLYITVYWSELESGKGIASGRETIFIDNLPHWPRLLSRRQLNNCRALWKFRGEASDHLVHKILASSSKDAVQKICHASRELQFMHATGLSPVLRANAGFGSYAKNRPELPCLDHTSLWVANTGIKLMLDEPYALGKNDIAQRDQWSSDYQIAIRSIAWSVYQPDAMDVMYAVSENSEITDQTAKLLASYPYPPIKESNWNQTSYGYRPLFKSPQQLIKGKSLRAPPSRILRRSTETTIPIGSERRPNGRMPLDVHNEIALILNKIEAIAYRRAGVKTRISRIKCVLDDWVQREYTAEELPSEGFSAMYYPGVSHSATARPSLAKSELSEAGKNIEHVSQILSTYYPACAPLTQQLKRLDFTLQSLKKWKPKELV